MIFSYCPFRSLPISSSVGLNIVQLPVYLFSTNYTVKKAFRYSRPQPGCHLPNSPWSRIIKLFPARESLFIVTSRLGREYRYLLYSISFLSHISHLLLLLSSIFFVPPKSFVTFVFFYVFLVSLDVTCIGVGTFPYFFKSRNLCVFVSHFSTVLISFCLQNVTDFPAFSSFISHLNLKDPACSQ